MDNTYFLQCVCFIYEEQNLLVMMLSNNDDTEFTCSLPTWLQFIIFIYLVDCGF